MFIKKFLPQKKIIIYGVYIYILHYYHPFFFVPKWKSVSVIHITSYIGLIRECLTDTLFLLHFFQCYIRYLILGFLDVSSFGLSEFNICVALFINNSYNFYQSKNLFFIMNILKEIEKKAL